MMATPMLNGLPWSDPSNPHIGYGFTDTIAKTGNALYSSVLYWDASKQLAAPSLRRLTVPAVECRAGWE